MKTRSMALLLSLSFLLCCGCSKEDSADDGTVKVKSTTKKEPSETNQAPEPEKKAEERKRELSVKKKIEPRVEEASALPTTNPNPAPLNPEVAPPPSEPAKGPDYRSVPDPLVFEKDKALFLHVPGETPRRIGVSPEAGTSFVEVAGAALLRADGCRVSMTALATGETTVLAENTCYGSYKEVELRGLRAEPDRGTVEVTVGDPESYNEYEGTDQMDSSDRVVFPLVSAPAVPHVAAAPSCTWVDERPDGRFGLQATEKGGQWIAQLVKPSGEVMDLAPLKSHHKRPTDENEDEMLDIYTMSFCHWMRESPHMVCTLSTAVGEDDRPETLWVDETRAATGDLGGILPVEGHADISGPSGCWARVGRHKLLGPAPAGFDGALLGWVGPGFEITATTAPAPPDDSGLIPAYRLTAECSSSDRPVKQGGGAIRYDAGAISDGNLETAWCEGQKGDGDGEWVQIRLPRPVPVWGIEVANGYQKVRADKYGDRYEINQRVRGLFVEWGEGRSKGVDVTDDREPLEIPLDGSVTDRIKLSIRGVYDAKYDDTCLSEVAVRVATGDIAPFSPLPDTEPVERAALAISEALKLKDGAVAAVMAHPVEGLVWEYCNEIRPDVSQGKPKQCGQTKTQGVDEIVAYFDGLEEAELYVVSASGVRSCKKTECSFNFARETSNAFAEIDSITLQAHGGKWYATKVRLVGSR